MEFFDLQLFAETEDMAGEPAPEAERTEEQTEPKAEPRAEPKYTDDDVNKLLERKFAEWQRKQDKKASEAERLAKMTAEEKAAERMKALEDKIHEYEVRESRSAMMKQARAILQDRNVHVGDELLGNLIAEDADATKTNCETFLSLFDAAVERKVKEALKGAAPKAGSSPNGLTKEQIMAVQNRAERQKLINENLHLFK